MGTSQFLTAKIAFGSMESPKNQVYSNRQVKEPNTFILDWDDTLMCTSFLLGKNKKLNGIEKEEVKKLGVKVKELLSLCKKLGHVLVITNSTKAWVFSTAEKYLNIPNEFFRDIYVFSTREKFSNRYPMHLWKSKAYCEIDQQIQKSKSVLCIGDNVNDVEEGKKLKKKFPSLSVATVKFMSNPQNPADLINEIDQVINNIDKLICSNYNMYFEQN